MTLNESDSVISNTVRIRDLGICRDTVDEYEVDCEFVITPIKNSPDGMLMVRGRGMWPRAVRTADMPYEDGSDDAWFDTMYEKGDAGFVELLDRLSLHIDSRLIVQAVMLDRGDFLGAQEWIVEPVDGVQKMTKIGCLEDEDADAPAHVQEAVVC